MENQPQTSSRWRGRSFQIGAALLAVVILGFGWLILDPGRIAEEDSPPSSEVAVAPPQMADGQEAIVTPKPIEGDRVVGLAFTDAIISLMETELARPLGWRPNDLTLPLFTDNVENYQRGVLEVVRRVMLAFNDKLARFGSTYPLNVHLNKAFTGFNFRSDKFWFPSTESVYEDALADLAKYRAGLFTPDEAAKGQAKSRFFPRADNLVFLIGQIREVLGSTQNLLTKQVEDDGSAVSFFDVDDYFYRAYGVTRAVLKVLKAAKIDFSEEIGSKSAMPLVDEVIRSLAKPLAVLAKSEPLIIIDRPINSIFNNHRAQINRPLADVRQKLASLQSTLIK